MLKYTAAILFGALLLAPTGASASDGADLKQLNAAEIAEMGNRVKIAKGLIAMGQKDGDAQYIAVGARILSELKADVVDPAAAAEGGKVQFYNPRSLMDSISTLQGGKDVAMSVKLSSKYTEPGKTICYWNYQCTSSYCGEFWDCGGY